MAVSTWKEWIASSGQCAKLHFCRLHTQHAKRCEVRHLLFPHASKSFRNKNAQLGLRIVLITLSDAPSNSNNRGPFPYGENFFSKAKFGESNDQRISLLGNTSHIFFRTPGVIMKRPHCPQRWNFLQQSCLVSSMLPIDKENHLNQRSLPAHSCMLLLGAFMDMPISPWSYLLARVPHLRLTRTRTCCRRPKQRTSQG